MSNSVQTLGLIVLAGLVGGCDSAESDGSEDAATPADGQIPSDSQVSDGAPVDAGPPHDGSPGAPEETFTEPRELRAADGVVDLILQPTELELGGNRLCLRAYGEIPAPTIRVADGTDRSLRIDLHNGFETADHRKVASQDGHGNEHCYDFNLTNLHAHGGHIAPQYSTGGDACVSPGCADVDGDGTEDGVYYADNVLIEVPAGGTARYRWDLDQDPDRVQSKHWPGMHWYHPHIHGSTAIQVTNGAAGVWIVEGDVDRIPAVRDARERIWVMNQIPYDVTTDNIDGEPLVRPLEDGELCDSQHLSVNNFLAVHHPSNTVLNGKVSPRLVTAPGQVERWRMVLAGALDEMWIGIFEGTDENCTGFDPSRSYPIQQFAADGITMPRIFLRDYWFMSPGYRVDALVKMPDEETTLCVQAYRSNSFADATVAQVPTPGTFPATDLVAIISVHRSAGEPTSTELLTDAELAAVAPPTTWRGQFKGEEVEVSCENQGANLALEPDQKIVLVHPALIDFAAEDTEDEPFESTGGACDPEHHHDPVGEPSACTCPLPNIDCRLFHPRREVRHTDAQGTEHAYRSDRVFTAGATELWELTATDGHPYHVHINPFVVCSANTPRDPPFPHWRDTYFVEATDLMADDNRPRRFLTRYAAAFPGKFVLHCHKLTHEDEGMMELIEVCPPGDTDCLCLMGQTENGRCVESNAGCFEDDEQCRFARAMVDSYSPGDYAELGRPTTADLTRQAREDLAEAEMQQCCQAVEGDTPPEILAAWLALGLSGIECCPPALRGVNLPGNPCR